MSALAGLPKRISVLDDEDDVVQGLERRLSKRGFQVERVVPHSVNLDDTLQTIMEISDAALCDHDIRGGHKVNFSGAQLVAALTTNRFPAVLFTGVVPAERWEIKRNMALIPAFLARDEPGGLNNDRVLGALAESVAEVTQGQQPHRRRGRRTPITVVENHMSGTDRVVDVLVSGWAGEAPVPIPADFLPEPWRNTPHTAVGKTFFAVVNIAESDSDQLYFTDFDSEPAKTDEILASEVK